MYKAAWEASPCRFGAKNEERESKTVALVPFFARPKQIPLLDLLLLRNQTETLATQARFEQILEFLKES